MDEILHQLICSLPHYLHLFTRFMYPRWLFRISEPSTVGILLKNRMEPLFHPLRFWRWLYTPFSSSDVRRLDRSLGEFIYTMSWRARIFGLLILSYQKLWSLRLDGRGNDVFSSGIMKQIIPQVVIVNPNTASFLLFQENPFNVFIGFISPRKSSRTHPRSPTMKGIPTYSLLVKVARGVLQRCVETTLDYPLPKPNATTEASDWTRDCSAWFCGPRAGRRKPTSPDEPPPKKKYIRV